MFEGDSMPRTEATNRPVAVQPACGGEADARRCEPAHFRLARRGIGSDYAIPERTCLSQLRLEKPPSSPAADGSFARIQDA